MRAARTKFFAADDWYFEEMDNGVDLDERERKGRNTWMVWTGGNDRFWDYMATHTFGTFDLLKVLSSHPSSGYCDFNGRGVSPDKEFSGRYCAVSDPQWNRQTCTDAGGLWKPITRDNRWDWYGLVNEPCMKKAKGPDEYGLWLDTRNKDCLPDPFEDERKYPGVAVGARGKTVPVGSYYGKASGVVGLRLFPNPEFDAAAKKKWDEARKDDRYYTDPTFYNDPNLKRPYRVGMSCAFCHVGPNPTTPPADPENPTWGNLSSNPGTQYIWLDRVFVWNANAEDNFILQVLHTWLPGTNDTSFVSTDYIVNPRTMNAIYNVKARLEAAKGWKEKLGGGALDNKQFCDFPQTKQFCDYFRPPNIVYPGGILKDGSDSAGVLASLNRVYLNIGVFSEEWLLHFKPFIGTKRNTPIRVAVANKNSAYWNASTEQTPDMALFLLRTAQPDKLSDAPGGASYLRAPGGEEYLSDDKCLQESLLSGDTCLRTQGKLVFAENCARCHSSEQPPNLCGLAERCKPGQIKENSADYYRWMREDVLRPNFLENNFLSTDRRLPMTEIGINACSPLATNALRGDIWDNFSSETYKSLPAVGQITVYDPVTGKPWSYPLPGDGRGYVRPPSLVSLWSTAPFLQNNSVGDFSQDPSVEARMHSFNDSIGKMLWPGRREKDPYLGQQIPGPSRIYRTTAKSCIKLPAAFLPGVHKQLKALRLVLAAFPPVGWSYVLAPTIFNDAGDIAIGPLPEGMPVGLIANVSMRPERGSSVKEEIQHTAKLLKLLFHLLYHPDRILHDEAPTLLSVSQCPDFIINKGHEFGSHLNDRDKRALIEFLKTF